MAALTAASPDAPSSSASAPGGASLPGAGSSVTAELFRMYAFPQLAKTIMRRAAKRAVLLRIAYAFSYAGEAGGGDSAAQVATIRALRDALGDLPTLIHCLAITITLERMLDVRALAGLPVAPPCLHASPLLTHGAPRRRTNWWTSTRITL